LETTIFNFYFAEDAPERRGCVAKLFKEIKENRYEPYTSQYVIDELERAPELKASKMLGLLNEYKIDVFYRDVEAEELAKNYIAEGVIPQKYSTDALHIAIATVKNMDFIVSLNFKHIVKRKTIEATEILNFRAGYKRIGIYSPEEVIDDG